MKDAFNIRQLYLDKDIIVFFLDFRKVTKFLY